MAEVYNFQDYKMRKNRGQELKDPRHVVAVYRSVVHFVHRYTNQQDENSTDHLATSVDLKQLYGNDGKKFIETFAALVDYWKIVPHPENDLPKDREFERFPTLGHLCSYIEKRVKNL